MKNFKLFLLPILTSIIFALIFYKLISGYFVFLTFVPFIFFIYKAKNWKQAFWGGFISGSLTFLFIIYTLSNLQWFGFLTPEIVFMKIAYLITSMGIGVLWGVFSFSAYFLKEKPFWPVTIPAAWILIAEFLRAKVFWGFTWGWSGYLTETIPWFRQAAVLSGILGLSFLIFFANLALFHIFKKITEKKFNYALTASIILVLVLEISTLSTIQVQKSLQYTDKLSVVIVHPDHALTIERFTDEPYFSLIKKAKEKQSDLILLPESIFATWLDKGNRPAFEYLEDEALDAFYDFEGIVFFGAFREADGGIYNTSVVWEDGRIVDFYDKHKLVPFAEYRPKLLSRLAPKSLLNYKNGQEVQILNTRSVTLASFVCQEVMYPEPLRKRTKQGAEILLSGANDGPVSDSIILNTLTGKSEWFSFVEHTMNKFRAIENGRYVARSNKVGISGIINPYGQDIVRIDSTRGIAEGIVYKIHGQTPYVRFGFLPLLFLSVFFITLGITVDYKRKKC